MTTPLSVAKRVVVKIGSSLVAREGDANKVFISRLASDIAVMHENGKQVLLVSSGAVALGRAHLGLKQLKRLEEKQAAAALGQPLLMRAFSKAFSAHNTNVAQALLTLDDTERRRRWLNARATLETLLEVGALPIINENDTVATDEIRYGDNDRLAARVAQMVSADVLVLLSDVDGLYSADPRTDQTATHIARLTEITPEYEAVAGAAHVGSGGMATKLAAAKIAHSAGCATAITLGDREHPLGDLKAGGRATWVIPDVTPGKARQSWLRGHLTPEGTIIIDDGAIMALSKGASLLAVGILRAEGEFARGAAVAIAAINGHVLAKGITAYGSADIRRIAGLQSDAVEATLGQAGRPSVIHRDDLVLG